MRITYDERSDAMYIYLSEAKSATQKHVTESFIVDIDENGNVVGIEVLDARSTYGDNVTAFDAVVTTLKTMCSSNDVPADTFIGIDGCKAGWVLVALDGAGNFTDINIATNFDGVVKETTGASLALIDIPIGLRDSGAERECDKKARALLGARKSSLFPVPVRKAVHAQLYGEACRINAASCGKKISQQTKAICPKIAAVDDVFARNPSLQSRVRETHPEVCFTSLNQWNPMQFSKKTSSGREERLAILRAYSTNAETFYQAALEKYPSAIVLADDIIDAMVCAVTAREAYRNKMPTIPPDPETDSVGLRMEMVCAESPPIF